MSSSSCGIGRVRISRSASSGRILPLIMFATVNRIGRCNLCFLATSTTADAVKIPSATSPFMELIIDSSVSPRPNLSPTCRFRERAPKHVRVISPTPARPEIVDARPPVATANFRISDMPRVTKLAMALLPNSNPCSAPAPMAKTFLSAPPASTPITSVERYTRKVGECRNVCRRFARALSLDATTTAVGRDWITSRAKDGPERKAVGWSGRPKARGMMSDMSSRV
mmetsp:Transcript_4821/g.7503  ORF Transcript_4821/g.7503 Transcript_4821/m.7503 type:complete len:226 (-) Transcript_4821:1102-1779(-)